MSENRFHIADSIPWGLGVVNITSLHILPSRRLVACKVIVGCVRLSFHRYVVFASRCVSSEPHPWPVDGKSGRRSLEKKRMDSICEESFV